MAKQLLFIEEGIFSANKKAGEARFTRVCLGDPGAPSYRDEDL
jgi:hypothetical protein